MGLGSRCYIKTLSYLVWTWWFTKCFWCRYKFLFLIIGKNVQLKVEHLMDLVHLVLESVVFVSLCPIIQILSWFCPRCSIAFMSDLWMCSFPFWISRLSKDWPAKEVTITILFFSSKTLRQCFIFLIYTLIDYLVHEISKEFWKHSHFENMRAGFLLRCQNWLRWKKKT